MQPVKLNPKHSCMHLDTSCLTLDLPDINLYIHEELVNLKAPITIFKKPVKSNSEELF